MLNEKVNEMFIGDFIDMIKGFIGIEIYNNMIKEIGMYNTTLEGVEKFKEDSYNWLVENQYCIF